MWKRIAAFALHILTLGIKARRQAAREKAKREQDRLIALREKVTRLMREKRER